MNPLITVIILMVIGAASMGTIHWLLGVLTILTFVAGAAFGILAEVTYGAKIGEWLRNRRIK